MKNIEAIKTKTEETVQSITESELTKIKDKIVDKVIQSPEIMKNEIEPLIAKINGSYSEHIHNDYHTNFDEALLKLENVQTPPSHKTLVVYFMLALLAFCAVIGIDIGMAYIPLHLGYRICLFGCFFLFLIACFFTKVLLPYKEKRQAIDRVFQAIEQQIQVQMCTLLSSCLVAHYQKLAEKVDMWGKAIHKICQNIISYDSEATTADNNYFSTSSIFHLLEPSREAEYVDYFINRFGNDEKVLDKFLQLARKKRLL